MDCPWDKERRINDFQSNAEDSRAIRLHEVRCYFFPRVYTTAISSLSFSTVVYSAFH